MTWRGVCDSTIYDCKLGTIKTSYAQPVVANWHIDLIHVQPTVEKMINGMARHNL